MNQLEMQPTSQTAVVSIAGRFDAHQVPHVQKMLASACADGAHTIIVDLSQVNFVDSSALATLVQAMKRCREQDGELILCGVRQPVRIIFELTRLDKAFRIFNSLEDAQMAAVQAG